MVPPLVKALELAAEEAARLGQAEVEPENLFFALFRDERYAPLAWLQAAGADLAAFRRAIQHRLVPTSAAASDVPLGALANEMLERLKISAVQTRRTHITPLHLLSELVRDDASTAASILARVGTDLAALRKTLAHD
jgi:ATP-dependent Clp protease ATP-binding subunit ClpA